jgi:hypothetical protein
MRITESFTQKVIIGILTSLFLRHIVSILLFRRHPKSSGSGASSQVSWGCFKENINHSPSCYLGTPKSMKRFGAVATIRAHHRGTETQRHRDTEGTVFCRAGRRRPGKTPPEGRTFRGGVLLASRSSLPASFQSRGTEAPAHGTCAGGKWRVQGGHRPALLILCIGGSYGMHFAAIAGKGELTWPV